MYATIALKTFLYEYRVNKLNSMYYSNWCVMSYMLFLACFTKCSVKCTHRIRVTLTRNVSTSSKKVGYSPKIGIGHQDLQCKCSHSDLRTITPCPLCGCWAGVLTFYPTRQIFLPRRNAHAHINIASFYSR